MNDSQLVFVTITHASIQNNFSYITGDLLYWKYLLHGVKTIFRPTNSICKRPPSRFPGSCDRSVVWSHAVGCFSLKVRRGDNPVMLFEEAKILSSTFYDTAAPRVDRYTTTIRFGLRGSRVASKTDRPTCYQLAVSSGAASIFIWSPERNNDRHWASENRPLKVISTAETETSWSLKNWPR